MNATTLPKDTPTQSDQRTIREEILSAAMKILQTGGVKQLSQARVAREAGIRQSHLTYYFPKKVDMIAALLQLHIDRAEARLDSSSSGRAPDRRGSLEMLCTNRPRMRFFMGLVIEADQNDELRMMLDSHIAQFDSLVADFFERPRGDRSVRDYLSTLRGYGMVNLASGTISDDIDVRDLASRFGLGWKD